jgi:hypothetical protein
MSTQDSNKESVVVAFRPRTSAHGTSNSSLKMPASTSLRKPQFATIQVAGDVSLTQLTAGLQSRGLSLSWDHRSCCLMVSSHEQGVS